MEAFLLSFAVIFVAELGDKSQLMALAFAARFPAVPVLIAITLATALVHAEGNPDSQRSWRHVKANGAEIEVLLFGRRVTIDRRDACLLAVVPEA